jgi:hypothetical protein
VKFGVGDVRVMPLSKKSHVVDSNFSESRKGIGWGTGLIWLNIGTHGVWPPVTVMVCGHIFRCS